MSLETYVISSMTITLASEIVIWTILKLNWGHEKGIPLFNTGTHSGF